MMQRRAFLKLAGWAAVHATTGLAAAPAAPTRRPPNLLYILADDLGYSELGCYGQKKIRTPNLDRLAAQGMRFTQHYSGSAVCAPARCVLMTGRHTGHAAIRNNKGMAASAPERPEGQWPLPAEEITLAERLKALGYATGAAGKWGLGGPGTTGHPCYQGFDLFYGYLCQGVAHNFYPTHLWRNHDVDVLGNRAFSAHQKIDAPPADRAAYAAYSGEVYAPDRMIEKALGFIRENKDRPFFLYYPTPVPHAALQVPEDSLHEYAGRFDDKPYLGDKNYLPHPEPRAAYAAMVTRMDRDIGRMLDLLKELGLEENTIVMFSSDNGPTFNGGTDSAFFESAGPLRGLKASLFEGGIRVPMLARWPGRITAGSATDHVSGFQDVVPTVLELIGAEPPADIDGLSMAPTLLGRPAEQKRHEYLYWELGRAQAVRAGDWKLVRDADPKKKTTQAMLFNLRDDPGEQKDLAAERPEVLERMVGLARAARTPCPAFPSPYDDGR